MSEIGSRNTCCVTTAAAFFSRARPSSDSSQSCLVGFTQPGTEHSRGNAKWGGGAEDRGEKPIRASRMRQMEEVAATPEQRRENGGNVRMEGKREGLLKRNLCIAKEAAALLLLLLPRRSASASSASSIPSVINSAHAVTHNKWQSRWMHHPGDTALFLL